jgi:probable HAF family extracellular repeat protein
LESRENAMHHRVLVGTLICVGCISGLVLPSGAAVQYAVTDMGAWDVLDINQAGHAAGYVSIGPDGNRGAFWSAGGLTQLSTLVGTSFSFGVNDLGQVAGRAYANTQNTDAHAVVWTNGVLQDLNAPGLPKMRSAWDINNAGEVIVSTGSGPYLWQNGQVTSLSLATVQRINNVGQIAGTIQTSQIDYAGNYVQRAALWTNGTVQDLGTLGGSNSNPWAMNDLGVVAGQADTDHPQYPGGTPVYPAIRATSWDATGIHDLGAGDMSYAYGINNLGQIVGGATTPDGMSGFGFLYSGGVVQNLNDLVPSGSGWLLGDAWGINDSGQIVGNGLLNGARHAFLLTLTPEPTSLALLAIPLLAWRRRRLHR